MKKDNINKTMRTTLALSRYKCKNLRFMLDFLTAIDKTPETAMQKASTAVSFRAQLHQDNMPLSRAREIIEEQGYELEVRFKEKEKETPNETISVVLEGTPERKSELKNLVFLEDVLVSKRMTMSDLGELIGIPPGTVRCWFGADDIRIAYLPLIAEKLDMILEYKIRKA